MVLEAIVSKKSGSSADIVLGPPRTGVASEKSFRGPPVGVAVNDESESITGPPSEGEALKENYILVPVVPSSLKLEILSHFYDLPESGHFSTEKTKQAIKCRFFSKGMNKEIAEYVKGCKVCQRFKFENFKLKGLMGIVPISNSVFETLYIDFVGPFTPSKYKRNRFCLVVVDQLSSWVELCPMTRVTSRKIAEFLEDQCFCHFGSPENIVSDNASNFVSKTIRKLCKE